MTAAAPGPRIMATLPTSIVALVMTFPRPVDAAPGDLLVAIISADGGTFTPPAGWTLAATLSTGWSWRVYTRSVSALTDEPTTYAFTAGSLFNPAGAVLTVKGVSAGTAIGASAQANAAATTAHPAPAVASISASYQEVCAWMFEAGGVALTAPADADEVLAADTTLAGGRSFHLLRFDSDAAPTLAARAGTTAANQSGHTLSLVLRDTLPLPPLTLSDPTPGNLGLLP